MAVTWVPVQALHYIYVCPIGQPRQFEGVQLVPLGYVAAVGFCSQADLTVKYYNPQGSLATILS